MQDTVGGLSAAMIGHGFIGHVHMDALRRIGVNIAGVLDLDYEHSQRSAAESAIPRGYHDLDELAADESIDVVHITSPNHMHASQAIALLRAGKNVVCEKPMAMDLAEATEMAAVAAESGKVAAVCFHNRFYPITVQAKAMVDEGQVGTPHLVLGHYLQDWLALDTDWNWRLEPKFGGTTRAVGDIGSHWLDLMEFITGDRIAEVQADFATFVPVRRKPTGPVQTFSAATGATVDVPINTEDAALVLLRFASGARGQMTVSQVSQGHNNDLSYEIAGSAATIAWHSEHPEDLWIGHRDAPNQLLDRNPALMANGAQGWLPGGHPQGLPDAFADMFRAVYADVAAGGPSQNPHYATFADGLRGIVIEQAILASVGNGNWMKVEES